MGFYQVTTVVTPEKTTWDQSVWVCKRVPRVYLTTERATPSWAGEGTVELVEGVCFGSEGILEPLNRF